MYKNKKISLGITSCKRIGFLKRVLAAFKIFCEDFEIIDDVFFFDDSSLQEDKEEMKKIVGDIFKNKRIEFTDFYPESFPDTYRHSRILNELRKKLENSSSDYFFMLEDDYLFVDFFRISETIDLLAEYPEYAYVGFSQSFKKFPENIKPKTLGNYWEWYYDESLPINQNLFYDDVAAVQQLIPELWMTYINWPSFSLRPGTHDTKKFLSVGEFSVTYDRELLRTELEFAIRWSKKYKSLCHKRFHIINLGFDSSLSAYNLNNCQ